MGESFGKQPAGNSLESKRETAMIYAIDHMSTDIYRLIFPTMEAALKDGHRMTVKGMAGVLGITPAQWRAILRKHYGPRMILTRGRRGGIQLEGITFQVLA
jgi:hypothetical protein